MKETEIFACGGKRGAGHDTRVDLVEQHFPHGGADVQGGGGQSDLRLLLAASSCFHPVDEIVELLQAPLFQFDADCLEAVARRHQFLALRSFLAITGQSLQESVQLVQCGG